MKSNIIKFHRIFSIALVCLAVLPVAALARENSRELAMSEHIRGKGHWNTCDMFARDLCCHMAKTGTEAHYVVYDWQDDFRNSGRHAFVVYRDTDGRYWGMDNQRSQPKWLSGKDPVEWVASFAGDLATKFVEAWKTTTSDNYGEDASPYYLSLHHTRKVAGILLAPNPAVTIP